MAYALQPFARYTQTTADTAVKSGAGYFYGVIVTAATATAQIEIRDSAAAGAGTILMTIPASTNPGPITLPVPIKFETGLYADFTGTGTVNVLFQ